MTKKVKMGKVKLPMDVRSSKDIPAFENMLSGGPMAVVLVYADWCGHCDTYKKNVWSGLKSTKDRTVNLASVHHDQLENTSLQGSKIDGYPSILVVGKDKKPAVFNNNSGVTNAMPNTNEVSTMKSLITTPVPEEATSMNANSSFTPTIDDKPIEEGTNISLPSIQSSDEQLSEKEKFILNDFKKNTDLYIPKKNNAKTLTNANNSAMKEEKFPSILPSSPRNMNTNTASFEKATTPTATNVSPPNTEEDEVENSEPTMVPVNNQGTTPLNLKGGRLFRKLSHKKGRNTKRQTKRKN